MNHNDDATVLIRGVLAEHAQLSQPAAAIADDADLYEAGLDSHASVNVMLALEGAFDVEFPDRLLTRAVFSSIGSIRSALGQLRAG